MSTENEAAPAPAPIPDENGDYNADDPNDGTSLADKAAKNKAKRERRKRAKQRKKAAATAEKSGDNATNGTASNAPGTPIKEGNGTVDPNQQAGTPSATGDAPGRKNSKRNNNARNNKQQPNRSKSQETQDARVKELEAKLKEMQGEKESMSTQLDAANKTIESLRQANPASAQELQLQEERDHLKAQLGMAKTELEAIKSTFDQERSDLKDQMAETTLKAQSQEIEQLTREHESLATEQQSIAAMAGLEAEKGKMATRIQELLEELATVKEAFAQQAVDLERNMQKLHETQMQEALKKQQALESELAMTQEELHKAQMKSTAAQGDASKFLQDKLAEKVKQIRDLEKRLDVMETDNRNLEQQLEKSTKEKKPWWQCG